MTRSDTVVIIVMVLFVSYLYSTYWSFSSESTNNYAQISITASTPQNISLQQDKTIKIKGRVGETVIIIKNKKIRFLQSPCLKKYCIHSGWLQKTGSIASCIPNGITISIKSINNLFDAINF